MKRFISLALMLVLVLSVIPATVGATEMTCITFSDGSYVVETLHSQGNKASQTRSGNKTWDYYSSSNVLEWTITLEASFSYNGSSATCTKSSCSVSIVSGNWSVSSKTASKSGNTATANVTMKKSRLGVTINTVPVTVTLTCDANGNLS